MAKKAKITGISMPMEDKKWRAKDDAHTLARAAAIKMDKERMKLASKAAKEMAKEKQAEANEMSRIAKPTF